MKRFLIPAGSLIIATVMAGCGSNGMSSNSAPAAISGKVADGYLVNATVFMDKNGNYRLDAGEPSTTTDANGAYTLTVDPADVGKYPVVAMATKGVTIDKDSNQPVSSSYVMSIPKDAVTGTVSTNFISPISTLVREMMETGKYANMQQAMEELRGKLGMPAGTNMMGDYLAGNNGSLHSTARNMATQMGGHMAQVFGNSSSASNIDVNRYRGMMGGIFSNLSSVRGGNQTAMSNMMSSMMSTIAGIQPGQPFRNMSSSFKGMMGGTGLSTNGMMGSGPTGSMMGGNAGGSMMGR